MLAIRLQRTGRKKQAQYRVVVQDSKRTPTSERIVHRLGSYDPHAKVLRIDKEKAEFYLKNGAQPSERVARLFKFNKISLPDWVKISEPIKREVRNPEKLRKHQPKKEVVAEEPAVEEAPAETEVAAAPAEADEKPVAEEAPANEEPEAPATEPAAEPEAEDKKEA